MSVVWLVWDRKGGDPTIFASKEIAIEYGRKWVTAALGGNDDVRVIDREREVTFFVGPLPLLTLRPATLHASSDEAPARDDYPRMRF